MGLPRFPIFILGISNIKNQLTSNDSPSMFGHAYAAIFVLYNMHHAEYCVKYLSNQCEGISFAILFLCQFYITYVPPGDLFPLQGRFEIISLSGSFLLSDNNGNCSRSGGLSVSLAGSDGRVLGGLVAGMLMAASPVQVWVNHCFHLCTIYLTDDDHKNK